MKPPADGWDAYERETLAALGEELDAIRARHLEDPPLSLLRAADADALPPELQARVSEHLSGSEWSRALVAGARDVEHSLDRASEDRLLARIVRSAEPRPRRALTRVWIPIFATAATAILVAGAWMARREPARTTAAPVPAAPQATVARDAPPYQLPLRAPDVRLSAAALTWRGPSGNTSLVDDLVPALDAYRQADYAHAAQLLQPLESRYPRAVEPSFYRGVSLLLAGDANGAIDELQKATPIADETFVSDVAWYLAVAEQRAGRTADARTRLDLLCRTPNGHAADACDAIRKLGGAR